MRPHLFLTQTRARLSASLLPAALICGCTIGDAPSPPPGTAAADAVVEIAAAASAAEAARASALEAQALCDRLREPGVDPEPLLRELRRHVERAELKGREADAALGRAEALLAGPAPER